MRKMNLHKIILYTSIVGILACGLVGCGNGAVTNTETSQEETESEVQTDFYLIMEHNSQEETFTLYSMTSGQTQVYEYGFSTKFKDKYGKLTSANQFTEGRFATISPCDKDGYLTELTLSDQVWEYERVRRFKVDEDMGVFTIADTKYSIQDEVKIFSDGKLISFSDISQEDILTVVGIERKVLSIVVTTGHGTLSLSNTELFEDSLLQLNNDFFAMITPDMEMEIPEGTYTLTVVDNAGNPEKTVEIVVKQDSSTPEVALSTPTGSEYFLSTASGVHWFNDANIEMDLTVADELGTDEEEKAPYTLIYSADENFADAITVDVVEDAASLQIEIPASETVVTYYFKVADKAGNEGEIQTVSVGYDTTAAVIESVVLTQLTAEKGDDWINANEFG